MSAHTKNKILLSSYIDGEISSSDRESLEAHLKVCDSCRG